MNLDEINIPLGAVIKVGVPLVTFVVAATSFWFKVESHHRLQEALDARVNAIECSLSIKRCDGFFSADMWAAPAMATETMEDLAIEEYSETVQPD